MQEAEEKWKKLTKEKEQTALALLRSKEDAMAKKKTNGKQLQFILTSEQVM